jgi:DNA (cytosine-5)-methyltransferase 1
MAYVEIEAFIIANLVAGMEAGLLDPAPIWTDAKTFDARLFCGKIHGIIGGYPCTPFSLAGTRSGEDHPGHIYPAISRAIEATKPIWCFFENVDDHLSLGFDTVYKDLQRMGYKVEAGIYSAEEVGAPHERERLFILAVANCYSNGYGTGTGRINETSGETKGKTQREKWNNLLRQWMWDVIGNGGEKLGNSNLSKWRQNVTTGHKRNRDNAEWKEATGGFKSSGEKSLANDGGQRLEIGREQSAWQELQAAQRGSITQFPSRPGEHQYDWEEPRTIESGVGCTINGYNFREDILRALGNSVVEQTAELAFIDLLNKHLKNIKV